MLLRSNMAIHEDYPPTPPNTPTGYGTKRPSEPSFRTTTGEELSIEIKAGPKTDFDIKPTATDAELKGEGELKASIEHPTDLAADVYDKTLNPPHDPAKMKIFENIIHTIAPDKERYGDYTRPSIQPKSPKPITIYSPTSFRSSINEPLSPWSPNSPRSPWSLNSPTSTKKGLFGRTSSSERGSKIWDTLTRKASEIFRRTSTSITQVASPSSHTVTELQKPVTELQKPEYPPKKLLERAAPARANLLKQLDLNEKTSERQLLSKIGESLGLPQNASLHAIYTRLGNVEYAMEKLNFQYLTTIPVGIQSLLNIADSHMQGDIHAPIEFLEQNADCLILCAKIMQEKDPEKQVHLQIQFQDELATLREMVLKDRKKSDPLIKISDESYGSLFKDLSQLKLAEKVNYFKELPELLDKMNSEVSDSLNHIRFLPIDKSGDKYGLRPFIQDVNDFITANHPHIREREYRERESIEDSTPSTVSMSTGRSTPSSERSSSPTPTDISTSSNEPSSSSDRPASPTP